MISFLCKRSRAADAKNDQKLGLTPSELGDRALQSWRHASPRVGDL